MAIDTKEKRANVIGVGRPWLRDKFPQAAKDEQWRIASGNAYGGNALSAAAAATPSTNVTFDLEVAADATFGLDVAQDVDFTL